MNLFVYEWHIPAPILLHIIYLYVLTFIFILWMPLLGGYLGNSRHFYQEFWNRVMADRLSQCRTYTVDTQKKEKRPIGATDESYICSIGWWGALCFSFMRKEQFFLLLVSHGCGVLRSSLSVPHISLSVEKVRLFTLRLSLSLHILAPLRLCACLC